MIEADRLVAPASSNIEEVADRAIRPKMLDEYIGQPQVRSQMEIFIRWRLNCAAMRWTIC